MNALRPAALSLLITLSLGAPCAAANATESGAVPAQQQPGGMLTGPLNMHSAPVAGSTVPTPEALPITRGIDAKNFDSGVSACSDFFAHANGGWLKANPIPADQTSWGTFTLLQEQNIQRLHDLLEAAQAAEHPKGSDTQLVGDFYASALSKERADELSAQPIWPLLAEVAKVETPEQLVEYIRRAHQNGDELLFAVDVESDFKQPTRTFLYVSQGGLGLPDRDYYLRTDQDSLDLMEIYEAHVSRVLQLAGVSKMMAQAAAESVRTIETRLAQASLTRVEQRETANQYAPTTPAAANKLTPGWDWTAYFDTLGLSKVERFSLTSPAFFKEVNAMLTEIPMEQWRDYLNWNLVRRYSPYLGEGFVDADFMFYQSKLRGQQTQRERWKTMVDVTSDQLGEPLGKLYVAEYFPPEAKAQALELIGDLKTALRGRLEKLDWMSDATRKQALEKLASFTPKIGYPDQWYDYSSLEIKPDDLVGNLRRIAAFERKRELARLGKPTDRLQWGMSPQTINAYYNPLLNEIVFPAAILQPPLFDVDADPALNYGGIGAVIGHEMVHGFDDQGSQYDAKGQLRDWWTPTDRKRFNERTAKLVEQYNGYKLEGLNVNGQLTLGENIADLGGVTVAYDALLTRLQRTPVDAIDDLTQSQRFFLSWAQGWRRAMRPEAVKLRLRTDPHSPAEFRTNGPLANIPAFAEAFACKPGDPMVRSSKERVAIW